MVELYDNDTLRFSFPEVHEDAVLDVCLSRTYRVAEDADPQQAVYDGESLCMEHVADYADNVPPSWNKHGGVMAPMYQSEAMWIEFESPFGYPFAVKVASGKRCAITGEEWMDGLVAGERVTRKETINLQNYLVAPKQKWLHGFCTGTGVVRQFVAMPLGSGATVEEQLTGKAEFGGLQIQVYPSHPFHYKKVEPRRKSAINIWSNQPTTPSVNQPAQAMEDFPSAGGWWSIRRDCKESVKAQLPNPIWELPSMTEKMEAPSEACVEEKKSLPIMEKRVEMSEQASSLSDADDPFKEEAFCLDLGLGAGGQIKQEIYKDEKGLSAWDCRHTSRVFVHLMNAQQWENVTSKPIDRRPLSREQYERNGLPWSEAYEEAVQGSQKLAQVKPVSDFE